MSSFNLSDWALRHKSFVIYLMLISAIAGLMAYNSLGREEDPPFTINYGDQDAVARRDHHRDHQPDHRSH